MLLFDTAEQLGVTLTGELQLCTGCSQGKGLRKAIPSSTSTQATRKLERLFLDLSGKKDVASIGGSYYTMIVCDDFTRYTTWVLCLKHKSDAAGKFEEFISSVSDHGQVVKVRTDEGGVFISKALN